MDFFIPLYFYCATPQDFFNFFSFLFPLCFSSAKIYKVLIFWFVYSMVVGIYLVGLSEAAADMVASSSFHRWLNFGSMVGDADCCSGV